MAASRSRGLVVVMAVVVVAAAGGWIAGQRVKSPADAAADAAPPAASRITVPVEERVLSSDLVIRGTVQFAEPTPVALAGSVGASAGTSSAVATRVPERGQELVDGQVVLEVSGRPVFVVQGAQPTFRPITPGTTGGDVRQLEEALVRFGFFSGSPDDRYDDATEAAVDRWYEAAGYESQGPTDEQRRQLRELRSAVTAAQERVTTARKALSSAQEGPKQSELLQLQDAVGDAEDALDQARRDAKKGDDTARLEVADRTRLRDEAVVERERADAVVAAASAPGAVNPTTGEPWTEAELRVFRSEAAAKRSAVTAAQQALDLAVAAVADTKVAGERAVREAADALDLARLRLTEAQQPKDAASERDAVAEADKALDQARTELAEVEAKVGTVMPAGELVFLPTLPVRVDEVKVKPGDAVSGEFMRVTGSRLNVDASVARADADLLRPGAPATIDVIDAGVELTGTVAEVADKPGTNGVSANRIYVRITPDDLTRAAEVAGASARIVVPVESTGGQAVLAVPLAALSTGADGSTRVQVERDGDVTTVTVRVGLSAQGYAQVTPAGGARLAKGDRVVVGLDGGGDGARTDEGDGDGSSDGGAG